ncbi:hypothetical protein TNCV_2390581 [Trichonephila clavipes]|nr:hypothetical protein TNCV_2390581 [Trichonephila clavipes]
MTMSNPFFLTIISNIEGITTISKCQVYWDPSVAAVTECIGIGSCSSALGNRRVRSAPSKESRVALERYIDALMTGQSMADFLIARSI